VKPGFLAFFVQKITERGGGMEKESQKEDELAAPKGCAYAFGIVIPIWIVVIIIINIVR
jgi:hypothetical protein